jgi:hypothetical protein
MPLHCIARNGCYEIGFHPAKNRVYLTITGFWNDPSAVPFYRADWQKALARVQPGFTVLADATRMKTHPASVQALHESIQRLLQEHGLRLSAKVVAHDDMADLQCDAMLRNTGLEVTKFTSRAEAEVWLDSLALCRPAVANP